MDILYYSNNCPYSKKVLHYLAKTGKMEKFDCLCVDSRSYDATSQQVLIHLPNGNRIKLPHIIHCVPSLLLASQKYKLLCGPEIISFLEPESSKSAQGIVEPTSFSFSGLPNSNVLSEQYTPFDFTSEDLSGQSQSTRRDRHHYVGVDEELKIQTPEELPRNSKLNEEGIKEKIKHYNGSI